MPKKECDYIIDKTGNYQTHAWASYDKLTPSKSPETEFQRSQDIDFKSQLIFNSVLYPLVEEYSDDFGKHWSYVGITKPAINRYDHGTMMLPHIDHIRTIFDGDTKGIPILTIVGNLNEEYTGGQFCFWDDLELDLSTGDIIVFPSVFSYQHSVKKVLSGTRYSFVSWVY